MSTACRCLIRSWEGEAGRPPGLYVIFTAAYPYFMNGACAAWASVLRLAAGSQNGFWSQSFFAGSGWLLTASGTVIAVITLYQVRSKNSAFRRALIMITRRQTNRDLKELLRQLKRISIKISGAAESGLPGLARDWTEAAQKALAAFEASSASNPLNMSDRQLMRWTTEDGRRMHSALQRKAGEDIRDINTRVPEFDNPAVRLRRLLDESNSAALKCIGELSDPIPRVVR